MKEPHPIGCACQRCMVDRIRAEQLQAINSVGGANNRLTTKKTGDLLAENPKAFISGFVICYPEGRRAIVDLGAVRNASRAQMWDFMHPKEPAISSRKEK